MMTTEGASPGFVQTSGGCGDGFGGSGWWGFLIIALLFCSGGFFGNRGCGQSLDGDIWKAQEFGQLENSVRANGQGIAESSWALNDSIKNGNFAIQREIDNVNRNLGNALCTTTYELAGKIDGVNFNAERNAAAINANMTAQTQKILDKMSENKVEALQNRINQLELQNAMAGVVRYPNGFVYSAGNSPFCGCGNCGYGA